MNKKERIQKQLEDYKKKTDCDFEAQVYGTAVMWSEIIGFDGIQKKLRQERQRALGRSFFELSSYAVKQVKAITLVIDLLANEGTGLPG